MRNQQKGGKKKEGNFPKPPKKEGRGFGRLLSLVFPPFCWFLMIVYFEKFFWSKFGLFFIF